MNSTQPVRISGIVPPVPTPYDSSGNVDESALRKILRHLVDGGCHGVFMLGSTGELASLDSTARDAVIRTTVDEIGGRIPVLSGITDTCPAASIALAHRARDLGADGVVLAAPYYYDLSSDELVRYISHILDHSGMPTLLYNMPWLTGHTLDDACLRRALEYPHMIGFKDSSGDLDYLGNMLRLAASRPEVTVLVGNDALYHDALKLGAHGIVGGGAAIHPHLFRSLHDAHQRGDHDTARDLQEMITAFGETVYSITGRPTSVFAAVKGALASLGLCRPDMALPLTTCTAEQLASIRPRVLAMERLFDEARAQLVH